MEKNRDWINKQCIYDFLCHINEDNNSTHCIVTRCNGKVDIYRCKKYNTCTESYSLESCGFLSCGLPCKKFLPDCKKCIADFLEERRCVR